MRYEIMATGQIIPANELQAHYPNISFAPVLDAGILTFLGLVALPDDPAPDQVPQSVSRRQAMQALLMAGKLDLVQPVIDAIADPVQRGMMQIEWDDAQVFERQRPSLLMIGAAIGLDDAGLDALFTTAAEL